MSVAYVFHGLPASGKSTLAGRLASALGVEIVSKDALKEAMFDADGWGDRAHSQVIGAAAFRQLFERVEELAAAGRSFIVDSWFSRSAADGARLKEIMTRHGAEIVEIRLTCDRESLVSRFEERATSRARHPGHAEAANLDEFRASLRTLPFDPLGLGGRTVDVCTDVPPDMAWFDLVSRLGPLPEVYSLGKKE